MLESPLSEKLLDLSAGSCTLLEHRAAASPA
jgi:hypothetical protein